VKRYSQKQAIRSLLFKIKEQNQLKALEIFIGALTDEAA